jgi:hypothetical protein
VGAVALIEVRLADIKGRKRSKLESWFRHFYFLLYLLLQPKESKMRLSLAFAALVAVVPAFANAIPPRVGTVIPLSKHAVQMTDDQGVINSQTLKSLGTRTSR